MKPLIILTRIMCVGLFWSVFFIEGIRVIMLRNWRFDIFQTAHWNHAWNLWLSGWVIDTPKEWAFILIILTFIPLWLSGWAALSMIKWENYLVKLVLSPWHIIKKFFFKPVKIIAHTATPGKKSKKKKSYKEVRPRSLTIPLDDRPEPVSNKLISTSPRVKPLTASAEAATAPLAAAPKKAVPAPAPVLPTPEPKQFSHSLFNMDDDKDDDFDFNIDDFDIEKASAKPEEKSVDTSPRSPQSRETAATPGRRDKDNKKNKNNLPAQSNGRNVPAAKNAGQQGRGNSGNSTLDIIKQHGYETINGATIKNNLIDFIGVSANQICLCLIDKEPGDWLADEERFNDEEPLWFSESSHRISPVRKADIAKKFLEEKLASEGFKHKVKAYVVIQIGNIINAEDMFEIWEGLDINVTRIDRGTPKEIKLFAKALDDADKPAGNDNFEKIKKLIRSIA